jgi:hypothetical protein
MFKTPILLIVFNRPDCVEKLLRAIAPIKPLTLFIAIDGPRSGNDLDLIKINLTKEVIDRLIDWDCEVKFKISNENQGVKMGPFNAIKWFFGSNEMGIVLEDDCIPDVSFFSFCQEMLERYSNDNRIGLICGRNDIDLSQSLDSYSYSTSGSIWGWASWARVINEYEVNDKSYLANIKQNILSSTLDSMQSNRLAYHLQWAIFDNYIINTWDYQLHTYLKLNYQLYIIPKVNLIQNIGFGIDASHTKSIEKRKNLVSTNLNFPLVHPRWFIPNRELSKGIYRADTNSRLIWLYLVIRFHIQNFFNRK